MRLAYSTLDCPIISVYTGDWFVRWETGVRGIKKVAQYLRLTDDGVNNSETSLRLVLACITNLIMLSSY